MNAHGVGHVTSITASDRDRYRDPHLATSIDDHCVAAREPIEGQSQSPQAITFVWIGSRQIEHEIRLCTRENPWQHVVEEREVLVVTRAVRELDVERARDLSK